MEKPGAITIANDGAAVVSSNYWTSDYARAGKLFASTNAGAVRLLLPPDYSELVREVRGAEYAVLSRGPWPEAGLNEAVEIMWEDNSDSPYALHLSKESFDLLPAEPEPGKEWIVSTWELVGDKPTQCTEHRLYWRRAAKLPCMQPLQNIS